MPEGAEALPAEAAVLAGIAIVTQSE
jgi:hypothetical protein